MGDCLGWNVHRIIQCGIAGALVDEAVDQLVAQGFSEGTMGFRRLGSEQGQQQTPHWHMFGWIRGNGWHCSAILCQDRVKLDFLPLLADYQNILGGQRRHHAGKGLQIRVFCRHPAATPTFGMGNWAFCSQLFPDRAGIPHIVLVKNIVVRGPVVYWRVRTHVLAPLFRSLLVHELNGVFGAVLHSQLGFFL